MHPERNVTVESSDDGEPIALEGFHELDSSDQVVWVEKPKRGR
jgi:hypothetical protein